MTFNYLLLIIKAANYFLLKTFTYLRYFFYLGFNWNFRIAWALLLQEIKGEKKYQIDSTGADDLKSLAKKGIDTGHATIYMPVSFVLLEKLFERLGRTPQQHFLDIGCGKGRAMCIAAHYGFTQITGIDISPTWCAMSLQNLATNKKQFPDLQYCVITEDAQNFEIPPTADCIFLFNPFDEVIMGAVVDNLLQSARSFPREINVIYANPIYADLFLEEGFAQIFHTQSLRYLEAVILQLPPIKNGQ